MNLEIGKHRVAERNDVHVLRQIEAERLQPLHQHDGGHIVGAEHRVKLVDARKQTVGRLAERALKVENVLLAPALLQIVCNLLHIGRAFGIAGEKCGLRPPARVQELHQLARGIVIIHRNEAGKRKLLLIIGDGEHDRAHIAAVEQVHAAGRPGERRAEHDDMRIIKGRIVKEFGRGMHADRHILALCLRRDAAQIVRAPVRIHIGCFDQYMHTSHLRIRKNTAFLLP